MNMKVLMGKAFLWLLTGLFLSTLLISCGGGGDGGTTLTVAPKKFRRL
ncbi:MAG: hypothetical protein V3T59_02670 [Desulfobacterales bacterium]